MGVMRPYYETPMVNEPLRRFYFLISGWGGRLTSHQVRCFFGENHGACTPRKLTRLAGKPTMNEDIFPIEQLGFSNVMLVNSGV